MRRIPGSGSLRLKRADGGFVLTTLTLGFDANTGVNIDAERAWSNLGRRRVASRLEVAILVKSLTQFSFLMLMLMLGPGHAFKQVLPDEFRLIALSSKRAIVAIGTERHVLGVGDATPTGVSLVRVDSESATFSVDGEQETVSFDAMGAASAGYDVDAKDRDNAGGPGQVVLFAERNGFYYANATVNGLDFEFIVDTGANLVVLNEVHAGQLGINLAGRKRALMQTAGGVVEMVRVRLDSLSVGAITVYDVDAAVLLGRDPAQPLLGMSFLSKLDMRQTNGQLELSERTGF